MYRIAICDDTQKDLDSIGHMAENYVADRAIEAQVMKFNHPNELIEESEKTVFDCFLLDVFMPMINGIEVGKELRKLGNTGEIIYLATTNGKLKIQWTSGSNARAYFSMHKTKGKTYKFKMRYFKVKDGKKVYSTWTSVKTIKVK